MVWLFSSLSDTSTISQNSSLTNFVITGRLSWQHLAHKNLYLLNLPVNSRPAPSANDCASESSGTPPRYTEDDKGRVAEESNMDWGALLPTTERVTKGPAFSTVISCHCPSHNNAGMVTTVASPEPTSTVSCQIQREEESLRTNFNQWLKTIGN